MVNEKQRQLIDYFRSLSDPTPPAAPGIEEGVFEFAAPPAATPEPVLTRLERRAAIDAETAAAGADDGAGDERGAGAATRGLGRNGRTPPLQKPQPPSAQPITNRVLDVAARAIVKAENDQELNPEEELVLEQIIIVDQRPVLDVIAGNISTPPAGWEFLTSFGDRIKSVLPAIGRIDVPGLFTLPYAGTGFVVGEDLLLTNRHVAEFFVGGVGSGSNFLAFRSQLGTRFDPKYEVGTPDPGAGSDRYEVIEALLVHPHWDVALLRVKPLDGAILPQALSLSRQAPPFFGGGAKPNVVVIGYPQLDQLADNVPEQLNIFRGIFGRKRVAPGYLTGFAEVKSKFGNRVNAVSHDATTLGGNSGSAVVDLVSGLVLALHFGGEYLKANYGVPSWELALDSHFTSLGVSFADYPGASPAGPGITPPAWLQTWDTLQPLAPQGAQPAPVG